MINRPPLETPFVDNKGMVTRPLAEWLTLIHLAANAVMQRGTTSQRPTANLWIGRPYYDTTLNLPIWVNAVAPSVVWKDAAGNTV